MTALEFLAPLKATATEVVAWGATRLRMSAYICDELPPDELVTSVRALVLNGDRVAVLFNANGCHPLPGGRRQRGESLLETLNREVSEETGCVLDQPKLLGFIHFEHLTPRPADYEYPHPHFFQVVYHASALDVRDAVDPDGWEERVEFIRPEHLPLDSFDQAQRVFVEIGVRLIA